MPPRRHTYDDVEFARLIAQTVAQAITTRPNSGSDDSTVNGPPIRPCSYKDFLNCKPLNFKGTEGAIGLIRWVEKMESVFRICNCPEDCKVKYATCTFLEGALTWWNTYAHAVGIDIAYQIPWEDLKKKLTDEYCPNEELQRLEEEFWHLSVQGTDITGYTTRFQQLALLCPSMVDPERKRIQRYIRGLPENIQGNVASSKPADIQGAIRMAHELMAMVVSRETPISSSGNSNKRKVSGNSNNQSQQPSKRPETIKAYTSSSDDKKDYKGNKPYCSRCQLHHDGSCPCSKCK